MPLNGPGDIKVILAPSILTADFARLGEQVREAEAAGADWVHIDVMDGRYCPNLTIGLPVVESLRKATRMPLDCHLQIVEPERWATEFVKAGADVVTFHAEACTHSHRLVEAIKGAGARASVGLNPGSPLTLVEELLPFIDMVNVLAVNPGFSGQSFIPTMLHKVRRLRGMLDVLGSRADLQIDGGMSEKTVSAAVAAGARVVVAGSAVFNPRESISEAIARLRKAVESGKASEGAPHPGPWRTSGDRYG